jgi:two-component system sensor histidine kinase ChvG
MIALRDYASRLGQVTKSITFRLALLPIIFVAVPLIVFAQLKSADESRRRLLHESITQQDRLVVVVLRPFIGKFGSDMPQQLQNTIGQIAGGGTNVKLFYRPYHVNAKGFFYIASEPPLSPNDFARERKLLVKLGVFNNLAMCRDTSDIDARFTNPAGAEEMLTSLTSISTKKGCWAVITSRTLPGFLQIAMAKPFWQTAAMRTAAIVYLLSAVIIVWLFIDIWRAMAKFRATARAVRLHGAEVASFKNANEIPELAAVAEDFDTLVNALSQSQAMLKRVAEQTAHALKLPIAIIAQSLEPLRKAVPAGSTDARRSIDLIERSAERLDGLVSVARDLEQAAADAIYPKQWTMNLSQYVEKLLDSFAGGLAPTRGTIERHIEPDIYVVASEDMIETVIENLLDNATSFSPPDKPIDVSLQREGNFARLSVSDQGPGVEPELLQTIFDRHFSRRPSDDFAGSATDHFGLGLWIVKTQVEGAGGSAYAEPNVPGGLQLVVRLPLAQ